MLSRTAENLYWTARYMERTDTAARLLEVGYRMSMMPTADGGHASEWSSILAASGSGQGFAERYGDPAPRNIVSHMVFDAANPSSMKACIEAGRHNARSVRTALTTEVWEAINGTYHQFQELERTPRSELELPQLTEWAKRQVTLVRGAFMNTQLENEGFHFFNLGNLIERVDNTARVLDVKYYVLLPTVDMVGGGVDNYQWKSILRSMSANRAFHWTYDGDYTPAKIAHFLILNKACPRSLIRCILNAHQHLEDLASFGSRTEANAIASAMLAELAEANISEIFDHGLHEFLTRMIAENARLSSQIGTSYLFGEV